MNRLEKFREIRTIRRKILISFFLALLLLGTGICIVDYSTNFLMRNEKAINIVSLKKEDKLFEIKVMNRLFRFEWKR